MEYRYIDDAVIGRHWSHHPEYRERHPGKRWRFRLERIPIEQLYCPYDDPGVRTDRPEGLMGSIGLAALGYRGYRIVDLAQLVDEALILGRADTTIPALNRLLRIRDLGVEGIRATEEPLAFCCLNGVWCVREGIHRTIALSLLGVPVVEGIVFESGEPEA